MNDLLVEALTKYNKKNISLELIRQLSSGKEAVVYLVSKNERLLALKVYKDFTTRSFKNNQEYLAGKHVQTPSERKAMQRKNRFGKDLMHRLWVKREFYMLKKLFNSGIDIPEPIEMTRNSILMEYIGDEGYPAPLLKDVSLSPKEALKVYKKIKKDIELMYENGIVHGDLSAFNILYWNGKPYIIDFPQSLDIRNNPNAAEILQRDRDNISKWYQQY